MRTLLLILMFGALLLVLWRGIVLVMRMRRRPSGKLKCESCRWCDLIDGDGVMCRYGETVTLKTRAHVNMCTDYTPAPGGKYRKRK